MLSNSNGLKYLSCNYEKQLVFKDVFVTFTIDNTELIQTTYRVDVPFLTSHIMHLKASAVFLYVQTLQSQYASSEEGFG